MLSANKQKSAAVGTRTNVVINGVAKGNQLVDYQERANIERDIEICQAQITYLMSKRDTYKASGKSYVQGIP